MAGTTPVFTYQVRNLGVDAAEGHIIIRTMRRRSYQRRFHAGAGVAKNKGIDTLLATPTEMACSTLAKPGSIPRPGVPTARYRSGIYVNVAQVSGKDGVTGITCMTMTAFYKVTCPVLAMGRMTGGGSVYTEDGTRVTHGFELHCDINIGPNNLEVNLDGNNFHLETLTYVSCYDDPVLNPLPRPAPFDTLFRCGHRPL